MLEIGNVQDVRVGGIPGDKMNFPLFQAFVVLIFFSSDNDKGIRRAFPDKTQAGFVQSADDDMIFGPMYELLLKKCRGNDGDKQFESDEQKSEEDQPAGNIQFQTNSTFELMIQEK